MKITSRHRSERPRRIARAALAGGAFVALLANAPPTLSQVVVHPNQIVGEARFTNEDPEILAELQRVGAPGPWSWNVEATSVDLLPPIEATTRVVTPDRTGAEHELTVESSAAGIAYEVGARLAPGGFLGGYRFAPKLSEPVHPEPADDVRVDFAECATLLRVRFTGDDGGPSPVVDGFVAAHLGPAGTGAAQSTARIPRGATELLVLARGTDEIGSVRVRWTVGDDPRHDTLTYESWFERVFACDEIVDVECNGRSDGEGDGALASIVGRFDVLGVHEEAFAVGTAAQRSRPRARSGPWGNEREDAIEGDPSSGPFELENLMPSGVTDPPTPYQVSVDHVFGRGRRFSHAESPSLQVLAPEGTTVDLGESFVMDPARLSVDVHLAAPLAEPSSVPALTTLQHVDDPEVDPDGDGIPTTVYATHHRSHATAQASSTFDGEWVGTVRTGLATQWHPDRSALVGDYELVLASPNDLPRRWSAGRLDLTFDHPSPGLPRDHLDAEVRLDAGERAERRRAACFGVLAIGVLATDGTFHSPEVSSLEFDPPPLDFLGRVPTQTASIEARGTPLDAETAATEGLVVVPLPEGRHVLLPVVQAISAAGSASRTEVLPVEVKVGCRQALEARPEVSISLDDIPPCADAGLVRVRAEVAAVEPIARATVSADGAAPRELCSPCGINPVLEADVELGAGDHAVTVEVTDPFGRTASATARSLAARLPSDGTRREAPPLRVSRAGEGLVLTWEDVAGATAAVARGTIASLRDAGAYDHRGLGPCDVAAGRMEVDASEAPAGSYFVVSGRCGWGETAPGRDSTGRLRPLALDRCP